MRSKPELLVSAGSIELCKRCIQAGADALQVGGHEYGLRMPGDMALIEIAEAVKLAHEHHVKVYVAVNNILANSQLSQLSEYLKELQRMKVDAILFGDPAVLMAMRDANVELPLHWNAEMTSTSYAAANYWGSKGATRAVLARELNLEEIHQFKQSTSLEVQVQVHGITNIYHSKRRLIDSYLDHIEMADHAQLGGMDSEMYLIEHERRELKLPIYQDQNGTHIMSADDICMIEGLDELLEVDLDSLKIEGLLKSDHYIETVVRVYREALDAFYADPEHYVFNEDWLSQIEQVQAQDRELTYGFFFKEQVY